MQIFLGGETFILKSEILGIFDFEEFTTSELGKDYFRRIKRRKAFLITDIEAIPQSLIITVDKQNKERYYLSPISVKNLKNKFGESFNYAGFELKT